MSDIAYKVIVNNNGIDDIIFKTIMIKGNDGSSIASIEKTSTAGNVDTYTIYLTDGTIGGTFTVTNGDASSLNSLTDVSIASATDGQALIYDATAGKWKNGDIAQSIDNLTDVDISSLAEGDMLIYDATTGKWTNGQTPDELSELGDVDITDAQTGESLIYDGVNQKWVNGNPSQSLAGLNDVDVASAQNGDVLKYNSDTGKWEDGEITFAESLDDLTDVEIASATDGQALVYDQATGKWVNGAVSSVGALDDLTDVSISNAQNNQELVYDDASSEWKNKLTRIELTQAEYDALVLAGTVLPNVDYYITDAGGGEIVSANPNISDAYDSTHNYVAGDLCIHDDVLWRATASTTGAWDASKWTRTNIDELLANKADKATSLAGYGITNAYTKDDVDSYNVRKYTTSWGTSCQTTLGRYQFIVMRGSAVYVVWLASTNDVNVTNIGANTNASGTGSATLDNVTFTRLSNNNLKVELSSNGTITIFG